MGAKLFSVALFIILCSSVDLAREIIFPTVKDKSCQTADGQEGVCTPLKDCVDSFRALKSGTVPTKCHFEDSNPIICCELSESKNLSVLERIKQLDLLPPKIDFECGVRGVVIFLRRGKRATQSFPLNNATAQQSRNETNVTDSSELDRQIYAVEGGVESLQNSWPWMALLGRSDGSGTKFFCSGILINENFVLTAAHCVLSLEPFFVRLGEHDYSSDDFLNPLFNTVKDFQLDQIFFHPNFSLKQGYNDVAILKLKSSVNFTKEISPICLPWNNLSFEELLGQNVTVAGWGRLSFGGAQSITLQEVNVTVFDSSVCEKSYSSLSNFKEAYPHGMSNENIICAGNVDGAKDACEGDSGGPIMYYKPEDEVYYLTGIISKGFGCGLKDFPGLYSPVRNIETLEWIKETAF